VLWYVVRKTTHRDGALDEMERIRLYFSLFEDAVMKKKVKQHVLSCESPGDPSGESLAGKIVHCQSGATMTLNHFCVVLQETPKTVLLAELSKGWKNDNPLRGYQRPLLQDGDAAATAVEEIFRVSKPRLEGPKKTTLIARLRMDRKYFDPHEVNEALWLHHIHKRDVGDDAVIVRVFRANKAIAANGLTVFNHDRLSFCIWDGQPKRYDHND
jgi:hypothetical protein